MSNETPKKSEPKRNRDWRKLDAAHRQRGELIALMLSEDAARLFERPEGTGKRGMQRLYSDSLIEAVLTIKYMFRLSLRAAEGFAAGLLKACGSTAPVPDYTSLCRRERTLEVQLPKLPGKERHVLMMDSTGLKVFGEGEWKVRQHGTDGKRRTWRKLHLLVDRESGQIMAFELTDRDTADCTVAPALLPEDMTGKVVLGDGAYHTKKLHEEVHNRNGVLLSPPKKQAKRWGKHATTNDDPAYEFRNSQLRAIKEVGREAWKKRSGMSKRSYVESHMHRFKSVTGDRLSARSFDRQKVEVALRIKALNRVSVSTARVKN